VTTVACPACGGSGGGSSYYQCTFCDGYGNYDGRDRRGRHLTYEGAHVQGQRGWYRVRYYWADQIKAWKALAAWFAREVPL